MAAKAMARVWSISTTSACSTSACRGRRHDVLREWRARRGSQPVLVLTARDTSRPRGRPGCRRRRLPRQTFDPPGLAARFARAQAPPRGAHLETLRLGRLPAWTWRTASSFWTMSFYLEPARVRLTEMLMQRAAACCSTGHRRQALQLGVRLQRELGRGLCAPAAQAPGALRPDHPPCAAALAMMELDAPPRNHAACVASCCAAALDLAVRSQPPQQAPTGWHGQRQHRL